MADAYTVVFAALLLSAGWFGDRLGGRVVFRTGLAVFVVASLACALAPSLGALIAARAVQGIGAEAWCPRPCHWFAQLRRPGARPGDRCAGHGRRCRVRVRSVAGWCARRHARLALAVRGERADRRRRSADGVAPRARRPGPRPPAPVRRLGSGRCGRRAGVPDGGVGAGGAIGAGCAGHAGAVRRVRRGGGVVRGDRAARRRPHAAAHAVPQPLPSRRRPWAC
ncbi:hypothetical protein I6J71_41945 [Amycolatopsis sp. FDAARGOS 1241]|nr:hypothetical protein I6J71_41945 [Amycolatopsis sp. FDAARGOS 1241]